MNAVLFSPHNDDEVLFASFSILRWNPFVVVCLRSDVQEQRGTGITAVEREAETAAAMDVLGADWVQWPHLDSDPDWALVKQGMLDIDESKSPKLVFAPAVEENGHEHHSLVGSLAINVFGRERVCSYMTYTRTGGRSTSGDRVLVDRGVLIERKLRAMACYQSQIEEPSTRPHFVEALWEFYEERSRACLTA